jgi:hypothetical protein
MLNIFISFKNKTPILKIIKLLLICCVISIYDIYYENRFNIKTLYSLSTFIYIHILVVTMIDAKPLNSVT